MARVKKYFFFVEMVSMVSVRRLSYQIILVAGKRKK
jgi:hypothetical protein